MSSNSDNKSEYVELPAQAYVAKILNRPGRGALNGLVSSFPAIKVFTSNAVPLLVAREKEPDKD